MSKALKVKRKNVHGRRDGCQFYVVRLRQLENFTFPQFNHGFFPVLLYLGHVRAYDKFYAVQLIINRQKIRPRERVYPYDIIVHNGGLEQY